MQYLMNMDDGGRRVDTIGLEGGFDSAVKRLDDLGSRAYAEPPSLQRHEYEKAHAACEKRQERSSVGHVKFKTETRVPDVGGLGWRTKSGHLLKNQAYYSQLDKVNKWDKPVHAGVNTWQEWHGPKMRTDAEMMEKMDRFEKQQEDLQAKKLFVNTTRVETLDRFYNRKLTRSQLESSSSWAPHNRSKREVHSCHELFESGFDEKPQKALKKVMTAKVLQYDREAIRNIAGRIQNEESWRTAWKQMEQERRLDIQADLQMRQAQTDMLMQMSGQPLRDKTDRDLPSETACTERTLTLAKPKERSQVPEDVTRLSDFRGLIHADSQHALEALFPGHGHELSVNFRESATRSCEAGFPPPPRAETPRKPKRKQTREEAARGLMVESASIPSSEARIKATGTRLGDENLKKHSMVQFLANVAPPPPNQADQLLSEDWSPSTSLRDPNRVTGDFHRTSHTMSGMPTKCTENTSANGQALGHPPPPRRTYAYPMIAPTSPTAKLQVGLDRAAMSEGNAAASQTLHESRTLAIDSISPTQTTSMRKATSAPSLFQMPVSPASSAWKSRSSRRSSKRAADPEAPVRKVCDELDEFEANLQGVPRISNFYGTPRKTGAGAAGSHSAVGTMSSTHAGFTREDGVSSGSEE
eukprot:TRINITY_DN39918_c0_g1_i1.p1 TRINITY_DN39918_c0_g1~~TRINITY_DN39918_c0_g1_i1.p1  ORF type:complete len:641 (+),score=126.94 TRINITY_DN39918_c0_g1_i1:74-1996(+)